MQELLIENPSVKPLQRITGDRSALPLSYAQQRLWFLDQLDPGSTAYNIPGTVRLKGRFDTRAFERAWSEIVRRHEALRTTFPIVNGQPVQQISAHQSITIPVRDLRGVPEAERELRADQLMLEDSNQSFDLARGPLLRFQVFMLADEDRILLFTMHHIISDGWSLSIMLNEMATLYTAFSLGEPSPLPEPELQYVDYADWQRAYLSGPVMGRQLQYWKKQLTGAPPALDMATDKVRPAVQTMRGAMHCMSIPPELVKKLHALCRAEGVTMYMTLLAAFKVLLARYTGQTEMIVGSTVAGRTSKETERLIGNFLNTLVLRTDLSGDPS